METNHYLSRMLRTEIFMDKINDFMKEGFEYLEACGEDGMKAFKLQSLREDDKAGLVSTCNWIGTFLAQCAIPVVSEEAHTEYDLREAFDSDEDGKSVFEITLDRCSVPEGDRKILLDPRHGIEEARLRATCVFLTAGISGAFSPENGLKMLRLSLEKFMSDLDQFEYGEFRDRTQH